ncbi:metalloprotease [Colletotrichum kahawae]|uniref:Metalloprotease n=1 Tax=Colletotrichum kahawae TaxID=34407 RepID=A0AAD9YYK4_COLKA|nr:metalloprotease [Colletotrichum kahawae]
MVKFVWALPLLLAKASFGRPFGDVTPNEISFKLCGTDDIDGDQHARDDLFLLESMYKDTAVFREQAKIRIPVNVFLVGGSSYRNFFMDKTSAIEAAYDKYRSLGFEFGPFTYEEVDLPAADKHMFRIWGNVTSALVRAHRHGGADTLNLFLVPANLGTYGFANFPWHLKNPPGRRLGLEFPLSNDALILATRGLTEDLLEKLVVHETGHWLGLYHTFQGGCRRDDDQVEDTPQQDMNKEFQKSCNATQNSCPWLPGLDPIRNYMTYTGCNQGMHFTPGQARRMRQAWEVYRDPKTRILPAYSDMPLPHMSPAEGRSLINFWMEQEPFVFRKLGDQIPANPPTIHNGTSTKSWEWPRLKAPGR